MVLTTTAALGEGNLKKGVEKVKDALGLGDIGKPSRPRQPAHERLRAGDAPGLGGKKKWSNPEQPVHNRHPFGAGRGHPDPEAPRPEGFQAAAETTAFAVYIAMMLLTAVAAAMLSWNYNKTLGTPVALAVLYAVLAFLFHELYIPMYAFFLNPVGRGGRRPSK